MSTVTVAVANQKGGVGKTALTLGLAAAAAERGLRTTVVDLDSQADATHVLLPDADDEATIWQVLDQGADDSERGLDVTGLALDALMPTDWSLVTCIPGAEAVAALADKRMPPDLLRTTLIGANADLVLIDCPPALGVLLEQALTAADFVLIPTEPAASSVDAVARLLHTVEVVRTSGNPALRVAGIVASRVPHHEVEAEASIADLRADHGSLLWDERIPRKAVASRAISSGRPVREHGADGGVLADAYRAVLDHLAAITAPVAARS